MPEYLSPGVYVEEVDAGPKPIEGVSTSTAGAVGVTEKGPTDGPPILVTSYADFQRTFGDVLPEPDPSIIARWKDRVSGGHFWRFPLAVKGFFDNGGQRLYIKRVVAGTALPAEIQFKTGTATLATPPGAETWSMGAAADPNTLSFEASASGDWGNQLAVRVRPMVAASLPLLANPESLANPVSKTTLSADVLKDATAVKLTSSTGFSPGDKLRINGKYYILGASGAIVPPAAEDLPAGTPVTRMRLAVDPASLRTLVVANASRLYENALIELDDGAGTTQYTKVVSMTGSTITIAVDLAAGAFHEGDVIRLIEARCEVR